MHPWLVLWIVVLDHGPLFDAEHHDVDDHSGESPSRDTCSGRPYRLESHGAHPR